MQIKTTLRFHLPPVRLISKTQVTANADGDMEKEEHSSIVDEIASWYNHSANLWFVRKLDIVLPEDPALPLLGIYSKDSPTYSKDISSTMFIAALFIIYRS